MQAQRLPAAGRLDRPAWAWIAVGLELFTGVLAVPVGVMFLLDPTGATLGIPQGWIEKTAFGSYVIPGIYLLGANGAGMLGLAALTALRHWSAPWLTGILGVGLIIWILVQLAVMPETMVLQWVFLAVGLGLGFMALFWLRRTSQLVLW